MNGKFLLDTNIIIALLANEKTVIEEIKKLKDLYVSSVVVGELYYGAFNSGKIDENVERINEFRTQVPILFCDDLTAKFYGQIKTQLKKNGTPIPENDIWIAALSFQHKLTLVSRD